MVSPLPVGIRLADRFEIGPLLGRGGFSIVYDVLDLRRGDRAALKEFVPPGSTRGEDGALDLGPSAVALRRAFLTEAQTLGRMTFPGVLPVRLAFAANGTAYVAVRRWLFQRARVFAVVGLPRETFLPHTSQRTFVLFAKRRGRPLAENERTMFLASERAGKDAGGEPVYRDEVLDHDLDEVGATLGTFLRKEGFFRTSGE